MSDAPLPSLPASKPFTIRGRLFFDRASKPLYALLAVEFLIVAGAMQMGAFRCDVAFARSVLGDGLALVCFAWCARWIGFGRSATFIELIALSVVGAALVASCSLIFASSNLPLADRALLDLDKMLFGFDRVALLGRLSATPELLDASDWIYDSVVLSYHVLLAATLAIRGNVATWTMVLALQLASAIALVVFPFVPAFGTPPYNYAFEEVFAGVRDGSVRTIEAATLTGIITFPSLHAAGGAMLAYYFARLGRWATPLILLNLLVIVSAILSGGHYLVDVIAGLATACLASNAANRLSVLGIGRIERDRQGGFGAEPMAC